MKKRHDFRYDLETRELEPKPTVSKEMLSIDISGLQIRCQTDICSDRDYESKLSLQQLLFLFSLGL